MKRVLITGGPGFIGRWTVAGLQKLGFEVHVSAFGETDKETCRNWNNIQVHECNLLDDAQQLSLMDTVKPTHLLHFAWNVEHGSFWESRQNTTWVAASLGLLNSFLSTGGRRILIAGSCAEYDWDYGCCVENITPLSPNTFYGTCKASLFSIAKSFCDSQNLSFSWGRIFHLYGPYENKKRFVPLMINSMLSQDKVKCTHGNQIRDFMHVKDVAAAFVALLDSKVEGPVNIASGQPIWQREVVETIANITEFKKEIQFGAIESSQNDPPILTASTQRLNNEVGFSPTYSLHDGLSESIDWWRKMR